MRKEFKLNTTESYQMTKEVRKRRKEQRRNASTARK